MQSIKDLEEQQRSVLAEIKQLENRQKILLNRKHKEERRERTHRLIEQGAILESVFCLPSDRSKRTEHGERNAARNTI